MSSARTSNDAVGKEEAAAFDARLLARGPLLVVVSGPSGAGKTVVVDALCRRRRIRRSVSVTTRPPRDGEEDGLSYHFLDVDAFERKIRGGEFAEWARYGPHYYGTLRQTLGDALRAGEDVVLTIDVQGGAQIRARCPEAVLVFILPPDVATLRRRLTERGTETEEAFRRRLERLPAEVQAAAMYDYALVNENTVDETAASLDAIIEAERHRMTTERAARCVHVQFVQATE